MTGEQVDAVKSLWDALSEILEDADVRICGSLREQALQAIEKARVAFPEFTG